jgi:UDP-N-acetylmuramyl pentapeptide phosphotransferase/UDP-N-acetylglucosamine-1-phosphate transferase
MKVGDTGMTDADALRAGASSKKNTPTMGGVLIAGAMLLALLLLADLTVFYVQASILSDKGQVARAAARRIERHTPCAART